MVHHNTIPEFALPSMGRIVLVLNLLWVVSCALSLAAVVQADTGRFVISGPEQVTDGWVSSSSETSFTGPFLRCNGRAWSSYDRVLIRFDLGSIDAARYAGIRKATLRLHVLEAENVEQKPTSIAPVTVTWTTDATATSPDGNAPWPKRQARPNIDYAMSKELVDESNFVKPGVVEIDVTDLVEQWLYQGLVNDGLIFVTGSPVFGRPDHGNWTVVIAASEADDATGPELVVELEGEPPTPQLVYQRALELYPSPLLPPVKTPSIFAWYGLTNRDVWPQLSLSNLTTYNELGNWLYPRGVMDLTWGEGGPIGWLSDEAAWVRYYTGIAARNPIGYCMHEWHFSSDRPEASWAVAAIRASEQQNPECYSAFYFQGQECMAELAAEGVLDLNILQGYTHVTSNFPMKNFSIGMDGIKHRVDVAREAGSLERTVVMLGHIARFADYHKGHELTVDKLDAQIGELREYAPQMPGIGFYYSGGAELAVACDALARKHFVDPAPDLILQEPRYQATLTTPHVTVRAVATGKEGRQVTQYRWFIDNRLVAQTDRPAYVWDLRGELPGYHFVTVHATDSGWNRAAAQVLVAVERP